MFTLHTLPEGLVIREAYGMICSYKSFLSNPNIVQSIVLAGKNEYQQALDAFQGMAPKEANAIMGVQMSIASQAYNNGTYLFINLAGTPVRYEKLPPPVPAT
jgi:hypothetical protein